MKNINIIQSISIFLIILLSSCNKEATTALNSFVPAPPDYTDTLFWYGDNAIDTTLTADIFYVYPTLGTEPVNDDGERIYYTDIYQSEERDAANGNIGFNKMMYADTTFNFFAPYYRQVTMETVAMPEDSLEKRIAVPYADISNAFDYYLESINNGRPFILLGHSQGSELLLDLIKDMEQETFNRMVAAYTFGWKITTPETEQYPGRIIPATGEDDTGVIICYNTITDASGISPVINNPEVCINPLNWVTDGTPASKEEHLGTLLYNRTTGTFDTVINYTGVYIENHFLIATDVDPQICFQESLKDLFPLGNLHFMDSYLYGFNIRKNMTDRLEQFQ